jgi:ABC-type oligopeptide transport system substrate-binding subunit
MGIAGAEDFCAGRLPFSRTGIEILAPDRVALTLLEPDPNLPLALSSPATWPIPDGHPKRSSQPIVLGRFVLERWVPDGELRFARNPHYYGELAPVAGVTMRIVPSVDLRVQLFLDGETDLVDELPAALAGQLAGHSDLIARPTAKISALIFNTSHKPFQLLSMRQAFASALKRDEVLTLMRWPHLVTDDFLPTPSPLSSASLRYSPSHAQELLASSHYDPARLALSFSSRGEEPEIAANLQAQWLKTLEMKVELLPPDRREPAAMSLVTLSFDPLHPQRGIEELAAHAHYRSPALETVMEGAEDASDEKALANAYEQARDILVEKEVVVLPLYNRTRAMLRREIALTLSEVPLEVWEAGEGFLD